MSIASNDDSTSAQSSKDESLHTHDRILFGNKTVTISDELTDSIDGALVEGVSSLPRLPHPDALLQVLRQVYSRNVNVLETYMGRNIFSIHQRLPLSRRKKVVEAFLSNQIPEMPLSNVTNIANRPEFPYPSAADIPSDETLSQTEQNLKDLRTKLVQLKRRRQQLSLHVNKLITAREAIPELPKEVVDTKVEEIISDLIQGKGALDELMARGKELSKTMDTEKGQWDPDDENALPAVPKKKKLKLEDAFAVDVQMTGGSLEGLKKMQQLLRGGSK